VEEKHRQSTTDAVLDEIVERTAALEAVRTNERIRRRVERRRRLDNTADDVLQGVIEDVLGEETDDFSEPAHAAEVREPPTPESDTPLGVSAALEELRDECSGDDIEELPVELQREGGEDGRRPLKSIELAHVGADGKVGKTKSNNRRCIVLPAQLSRKRGQQRLHTRVRALVDSGATSDCVSEEAVVRHRLQTKWADQPIEVHIADGSTYLVDRVAVVTLRLAHNYRYQTEAFVLPLGIDCEFILGQEWLHSLGKYETVPADGTISFEHGGNDVVLVSEAAEQAEPRVEVLRGAKESDKALKAHRRAKQKGEKRHGFHMYLNPKREKMREGDPWRTLPLLARTMGNNRSFLGEWDGVSQALQQVAVYRPEHRVQVAVYPASRRKAAAVYLINADERDCLYPFDGDIKTSPLLSPSRTPETASADDPRRAFVADVLAGSLRTNRQIEQKDWERYGLNEMVQAVHEKRSRMEALKAIIGSVTQEGLTLGREFWQDTFREQLTEELKQEYDDWVIREEILPNTVNPHMTPMPIRLKEDWDGVPAFQRCRRMAPKEMEVLRGQLTELLEKGLIQPSTSAWGAPAMVLPKPHQPGRWRLVIDWRKLNELVVSDRHGLPSISALIDSCQGKQIFSTFDLASGFYSVPLYEPHWERTAFQTPFGSFEWKVVAMGLKNSPSQFMRQMQAVFHDMPEVRLFVDDGCVASNSVEENFEMMIRVLDRLGQYRLVAKGSKLQLFKESVKFLGYVVSADGLAPQEEKVKAIQEWPLPTNMASLRGFLGLANFYRKWIYLYGDKARPLVEMTCKGAFVPCESEWTDRQLGAFHTLKRALVTAPVLVLPDPKRPYLVQTDASGTAMGAVLMQDQGSGFQPVCFASKTFTEAEQRYHTAERELRALVWATRKSSVTICWGLNTKYRVIIRHSPPF